MSKPLPELVKLSFEVRILKWDISVRTSFRMSCILLGWLKAINKSFMLIIKQNLKGSQNINKTQSRQIYLTWLLIMHWFFIFFSFIHMCIQCLGHFSPLPPAPSLAYPNLSLSHTIPSLPGRNYFKVKKYKLQANSKLDKVS
jgi:hypothetical protein